MPEGKTAKEASACHRILLHLQSLQKLAQSAKRDGKETKKNAA
jgi:hypothetical protein